MRYGIAVIVVTICSRGLQVTQQHILISGLTMCKIE
ncbi:MAG: hypothetical protein TECD_00563 [Hyphomicrobiaceae bacterium hypho_1]